MSPISSINKDFEYFGPLIIAFWIYTTLAMNGTTSNGINGVPSRFTLAIPFPSKA
jgi:hypothetical protein